MIAQRRAYLDDPAHMVDESTAPSSEPPEPTQPKFSFRGNHTAESLEGMLLSAHPHTLYVGITAPAVTLRDILDANYDPPRTYFAHYFTEGLAPADHLQTLLENVSHRLVCTFAVNGKLDGIPLLSRNAASVGASAVKTHNHAFISHLIPEYCSPLGKAKYYFIGVVAPSLIWRLQSLYLAEEASDRVGELYGEWTTKYGNHQQDDDATYRTPDVNLSLEAITPRMAMECMNSERLEMYTKTFTITC